MAEPTPHRFDVGGYLIGQLDPGERAGFEQQLAADDSLRITVEELSGTVAMLENIAPPDTPPVGLEARTFRALERAVATDDDSAGTAARSVRWRVGRPWLRRVAFTGAAAAVLAAAVLAGTQLADNGPPGSVEVEATLTAPGGGGRQATAVVRETGIGRVVSFNSSSLPILPKGDYYALWFVGPGDSGRSPDRISAGTFHPDPDGGSRVRFTAAVDPAKYPVLAVTVEKGDGDPAPTLPDVLRSRPGR